MQKIAHHSYCISWLRTLHPGLQPRWTTYIFLKLPGAFIPIGLPCTASSSYQNVFCPNTPQLATSHAVSCFEESPHLHPNTSIPYSIVPHVSFFPPLVKLRRDPRSSVGPKKDHSCHHCPEKRLIHGPHFSFPPSLIISPLPSCLRPSGIISHT